MTPATPPGPGTPPAGSSPESASGRWVELQPAVWETVVRACACCGQVTARRMWVVPVEGVERSFCSQACEELYRAYVLPRQRG